MRRLTSTILLAVALASLTACSKPMYEWGTYERSTEELIVVEDPEQLEEQIQRLSLELEQATNTDRPVPPGMRAHLAYLHFITGDTMIARGLMVAEKQAFPESAVFVDGMIGRMR